MVFHSFPIHLAQKNIATEALPCFPPGPNGPSPGSSDASSESARPAAASPRRRYHGASGVRRGREGPTFWTVFFQRKKDGTVEIP